jgi:hypothetical protein
LLLRVKQDDAPARRIQFSDLLIEAENDLVSIGDELAAQAIDIGFAGLALIRRSLLLGYRGDRPLQLTSPSAANLRIPSLKLSPGARR